MYLVLDSSDLGMGFLYFNSSALGTMVALLYFDIMPKC